MTAADIKGDLYRLKKIIQQKLADYFYKDASPGNDTGDDNFLVLQNQVQLDFDEQVILLMGLAPHIYPNFFDEIIKEAMPQGGDFPEFGGVRGSNHRGLLPTGETAQFIIAGSGFQKRLEVQMLFADGGLIKENMVWLENVKEGEPVMSGRIIIANEWINKLLTGRDTSPKFSNDFPARKITTQMSWEDLVLNTHTTEQIKDIMLWLKYNPAILQDEVLSRKIKPGYRILFHGSSGTGKTLTATLLGKQFEKDVYRIDLSQVVSKYIGETEKNLEKVFARAEHKNWILFFDEADALFGKRTSVQNAHDRYANQEVSYLLQRIEDYPGLLILASNFKNNLDTAFTRRFHTIIHFPLPNAAERLILWEKSCPASLKPGPGVDLKVLAGKYELTGAAILNVMHYATLKATADQVSFISNDHLLNGIRREFRKDEKTMS